jgi:hypothetical protein
VTERLGVDLSSIQGDIPTTGLEHLSFAFVKATQGGSYKNPDAVQQCAALRSQGVQVGYYHYVTMDPVLDQLMNMRHMMADLGDTNLPVAFDIEETDPAGWPALASMLMQLVLNVEGWTNFVPNQRTILYANLSFYEHLQGFPWGRWVWLADPNAGAPHRPCLVLQSAPRLVSPFPAAVDPDVFLGSDADWAAFTGGQAPPVGPSPAPVPQPVPTPAPPAPAPEEAAMAVSQAVSYRPGQTDTFQVSDGALWHHYVGSLGQATESLGAVAKVPAGTNFVGQPGVSVIGGPYIVTVEDSAGHAWWFAQGPTGGWTSRNLT